jgi:hypothetical protein
MYNYFMQDSAISHMVYFSLATLEDVLNKQLVTRLLWFATDTDLIPHYHDLCEKMAEFM